MHCLASHSARRSHVTTTRFRPDRSRGELAAGRCKAAGSKKPEAYSPQYVEDFLEPRTTQMLAARSPQRSKVPFAW
jgi:hypothetical protein